MSEAKHTVVVGCLVRNAANKILLIRHHRRGWEIPQGRLEAGESLLAALLREVREETGVHIVAGPLAAVYTKLSPPSAVIFTFLGTYQSGELHASEESPEVGWFDPDEARRRVTHPVNRDRLDTLLGFDGRVAFHAYTVGPFKIQDEMTQGGKQGQ